MGGGILLGNTYLLGQRISLGGMGEVFEATHARLPGRYAVKILRPELLGNREAFARFCREAEVMSELRHPNVVQIYDFNTTPEGRPYFVMEHLEGRDLEARLTQSGPMSLPAAVRVVDAVASALATAHSHGIVHRDLKPANIFLVAIDGQVDELVKVLDFGISKIRSAGTLLSSPTDMIGSPAYMSPEQARGAADEIDGRSDQFALGAITYRMLTGSDPFRGDDIASLLYQVVHEEAPRLARTLPGWWDTRALQAVLDRALAKDPANRFNGMMELARAFEAASEQTLSHEMAERGTVNLGATLIAAPPPPPLRPARTPAAAEAAGATAGWEPGTRPADRQAVEPSEIEDSAPPIRTPAPEPMEPVAAVAPAPTPRPRRGLDFSIDDGAATPNGSPPRSAARSADWEEPYLRDQLPVTHHRVALAALALLAIAGILGVTGVYRHLISGGRRVLGLGHPVPAQSAPRPPATAAPPAEPPVPGPSNAPPPTATTPAPETTAPVASKPAPAEAAPERPSQPSRQSRPAPPRSARRRPRALITTICRPSRASSTDQGASTSLPPRRRRSTTSSIPSSSRPAPRHPALRRAGATEPVRPAAQRAAHRRLSAGRHAAESVQHPAAGGDRGLAVARSRAAAVARAGAGPGRQSTPPPAPSPTPGPAAPPRTTAPPAPSPAPRTRGPADQPMAPSF